VGTLPMVKSWSGRLAPAVNGDGSALARPRIRVFPATSEAIRTLRNSILLADFDRRLRSLLITSATPGEGKTTTAFTWPSPTPSRATGRC
jgi:succinoglycan biosynthesis transport protein ExoP